MQFDPLLEALPAPVTEALIQRGFTSLTPVQRAVLEPELAGRDLRISSQTGSGKTVAVGFVLANDLVRAAAAQREAGGASRGKAGSPFALLIAPTRELAAQLAKELGWLLAPLNVRVTSVIGGGNYSLERRALSAGPLVVVGTPGRLLDHLNRGSIDTSAVGAVVLDEADQMLDLGFRDELEAILQKTPPERRTHLVSATFSREVVSLADRYQRNAFPVEGTPMGDAHGDITHVAHLVRPGDREAALRNLLLLSPGERALVFVRTRADASEIADRLADAGLPAGAISGELEQRERTRILDAFRTGKVTTLVATDVAARGIDVPDVARVIHADPPSDPETLIHRSGRTGRAGRKGKSIVLVPPIARQYMLRCFRIARVEATWAPPPSPADVLTAADLRLRTELSTPPATPDERLRTLAADLLGSVDPTDLVAALLARAGHTGPCAPLPIAAIEPPRDRGDRPDRGPRPTGPAREPRERRPQGVDFVPFRINWGERHGADPRRLLALVCRRGNVRGDEIGAIRIGPTSSTFEVSSPVATEFARTSNRPDVRDPKIRIDPEPTGTAAAAPTPWRAPAPTGGRRPPQKAPFRHA